MAGLERPYSFAEFLVDAGSPGLRPFILQKSYERMGWVYAAINCISTTAAGAPLAFYSGNSQDNTNRITDLNHPVVKLFNPPNPPEVASFRDLIYRTFVHLGIAGIVWWVFSGKKRVYDTVQIKHYLRPKLSNRTYGNLLGWEEQYPGGTRSYSKDDVLVIRYFNPMDLWSGLSPLSAARLTLESEYNIAAWNSSYFRQGMKNPLLLQSKTSLTKAQKEDIKKEITKYYSGIEGGQGALLLQGGIETKPLVLSPKDIDFIQGKKLNREEILGIYGVPPALVGIFEYSSYANTSAQRKIFWENTLLPKMFGIAEVLQVNIIDRVFPGITVKWDLSNVDGLKTDPAEVANAAKTYSDMGVPIDVIGAILKIPELANLNGKKKKPQNPPIDPTGSTQQHQSIQDFDPKNFEEDNEDFLEKNNSVMTMGSKISQVVSVAKQQKGRIKDLNEDLWVGLWKDAVEIHLRDLSKVSSRRVHSQSNVVLLPKVELVVEEKIEDYLKVMRQSILQLLSAVARGREISQEQLNLLATTLTHGVWENSKYNMLQALGCGQIKWCCRDELHKELDGKILVIGEVFKAPDLTHPHAEKATLDEHIGCTCTIVPVVPKKVDN